MSTEYPTFTASTLVAATKPTFYFIGVTTGKSSIRKVFPKWAEHLGLGDIAFVGIDMPLHAPADDYRTVVQFLKDDELSLGALVTTHKLDLFQASKDLFDYVDPLSEQMDEISCISKADGQFRAHAKDPITAGFAVDAIVPKPEWKDRTVFLMGAGGSSIAIAWHLAQPSRAEFAPKEIIVSNRSQARLDSLTDVYAQFDTEIPLRTELTPHAGDNDRVLAELPEGSFVANATGLGKDAPGSPLTDDAVFPKNSIAWDLNYRGDLVFLDQARAQEAAQNLTVEDGWVYFIHGWTRVIAEVFHVDIATSGPEFDAISEIAAQTRGA